MANPYVEVALAGYNSAPPSDDGQVTAANQVNWDKHKVKLGDPLKTGFEATQTAITAALDKRWANSRVTKTGAYTITVADRGQIVALTGASSATFTLPTVADAGESFELILEGGGTGVLTIDGNAAETVVGELTYNIYPGEFLWLWCDGSNWQEVGSIKRTPVVAKTTAYTVLPQDHGRVISGDTSGGAFTVTLPAVATVGNGFSVTLQPGSSSTNALTADGDGSETIDGALTIPITHATTLVTDGTEWFVLGKNSGRVRLEAQVASASATIEFTDLDSTYNEYILECRNVLATTDDVSALIRVSDDNGSTFKSGASDYLWGHDGTTGETLSELPVSGRTATNGLSNVAGDFYNGTIRFFKPASSGKTHFRASYSYLRAGGTDWFASERSGRYDTAVATDAVQFSLTSGNIAEGDFTLYGVK